MNNIELLNEIFNTYLLNLLNLLNSDISHNVLKTSNHISPSTDLKWGDYQTNIAMRFFKKTNAKNPKDFGNQIIKDLQNQSFKDLQNQSLTDFNNLIEELNIAGPGFINIRLKDKYLTQLIDKIVEHEKPILSDNYKKQKIVIDYSSPNIAKEMHVGHLRSTIIGDVLGNVLEYRKHTVTRINHIGDWGTQFGMLIAYLEKMDYDENLSISDLHVWYKESKKVFDLDSEFNKIAHQRVVDLQCGDVECLKKWKKICEISSNNYQDIYKRLNISKELKECGESFYNKFLPEIVEELENKNLLISKVGDGTEISKVGDGTEISKVGDGTEISKVGDGTEISKVGDGTEISKVGYGTEISKVGDGTEISKVGDGTEISKVGDGTEISKVGDGTEISKVGDSNKVTNSAKLMFVKKNKPPLIIKKGDGGYGYDTTDMAALKYRTQELKAEKIIYVTDSGQSLHFELLFEAGKKAEWLNNTQLEHVSFGVVLGDDGKKIKSRSGETIKLTDVLDQGYKTFLEENIKRKQELNKLNKLSKLNKLNKCFIEDDEMVKCAQIIGWSAIKYADLRQNRINNYQFDYKKMLDNTGDTIVYQLYAWVRIKNLFRKTSIKLSELKESEYVLHKTDLTSYNTERELALHLTQFDEVLIKVEDTLYPNYLCEYMYKLASKFNHFWRDCRVLNKSHGIELERSRLKICFATQIIMKACFNILSIPADEIKRL